MGAWRFDPIVRTDARGHFLESFTAESVEETLGRNFPVRQVNTSFSVRGTIRGVHFAQFPRSQAKYVQCVTGEILDIVVDVRVGSPTYGAWDSIVLNDQERSALFVAEGLGHAFCALSETATVVYLCSEPFAPSREFGVNPLDPDLDLPWPGNMDVVLSPKDEAAPMLVEAVDRGLLPTYDECLTWYDHLRWSS